MKEFVFAAESAHFCFQSVGEDEESVVVKKVGDGVQIVAIVIEIGGFYIYITAFQLDEKQGQAIYEANNICAAAVGVAVDFQLRDSQEAIVVRLAEVNHAGSAGVCFSVCLAYRHGNAVTNEVVFFLVDLHEGSRGKVG